MQIDTPKVGVGVVGWGSIAQSLHGPCLSEMDKFELLAVCDTDPEQLEHAKEKHECKAYQDMKAFLQHPDLELVIISVPNHLHGPLSIAALESSKHVVVEKPMCLSTREADRMIQLANRNHLVLTVHQNRRWDGDFLAIKTILQEGKLGKVVMVQSRHRAGPYTKRSGWGVRKESTGGGAFLSMGPHLIDQILCIAPPGPIHVYGVVRSIINEEDYFNCFLEFADGWTAQIELSRGSRIRSLHRFYVMCERGDIRSWTREGQERGLTIRSDDGAELRQAVPADPPLYIHSRPFYRNVYDAIRIRSPVIVAPELSRRYVAIAGAIARSSRNHECVVVP